MIAIGRGFGFGVLAGRALGAVVVAGGWLLSAGAGAGMAQVTSSVTFSYLNKTQTQFNTANTPASGTVTFLGTSSAPTPNQANNDFWTGITGIQAVGSSNGPSFNYNSPPSPGGLSSITNFTQFYFLGTCSICGDGITPPPSSSFITVTDSPGTTAITDPIPGLLLGYLVTNSGGPINIEYGDTGQTGTISFNANNIVATDATVGTLGNGGSLSFTVNQSNKVPGPLSILGASTAFAFSRKLRRRVATASQTTFARNTSA
jgi:hypothetical protein